jgi:hypothetical protein
MGRRRGAAVAGVLLLAALAAAGCGLGPGADVGKVELTVTREYGAEPVASEAVEAKESSTVMRVLEGAADVETRYGGAYVKSIDGVEETERGGAPYDWFYYVDGIEAPVGASDTDVSGGERIWWDYRDWSATNHVPAVVGQWPAPFAQGYEGHVHPVTVECDGGGAACGAVETALEGEGVTLASGAPKGAIRVLVGPWGRLRSDPAAALVEKGPAESGIYADFEEAAGGWRLVGLDEDGSPAKSFGAGAGLVAATRHYEGPPVWLVTGATEAGVGAAAGLLDASDLRDHYAVASEAGRETPLPLRSP